MYFIVVSLLKFIHVNILHFLVLDTEIVKGLPLGRMAVQFHQDGQGNAIGHSLVVAKGFSECMAGIFYVFNDEMPG